MGPALMAQRIERRSGAWALVAAAFVAGAVAVVHPWVLAGAAVAVGLAAWTAGHRLAVVVAVVALVVGAVRGHAAVTRHEERLRAAAMALPHPARCEGEGVVTTSPVETQGALRVDVDVGSLTCEATAVAAFGRVALYGVEVDVARTDGVRFVATLAPPTRLWNEATGDPRPPAARRAVVASGGALALSVVAEGGGILAWVDRARNATRRRIHRTFAPDADAMARALVLGETDLTADDDEAFRKSGLAHLLAVSGTHLVITMALLERCARALFVRIERWSAGTDVGRAAAALTLPATWLYAAFAGASGSAVRAACMASALLAARIAGRRGDGGRALAVSMVAMAVVDPLAAFDVSFALSVLATAGLFALARPIEVRLAETIAGRAAGHLAPLGPAVLRALAVTAAATAACAPLLATLAPTLPIGGLFANVLAVPLGEMGALPLCLLHAVLWPFPLAERGCAIVASAVLLGLRAIARAFASPSILALPTPSPTATQLAVMAAASFALLFHPRARQVILPAATALLLLFEGALRLDGAPRGTLRVTFLDVGQGDAALVDLPDRSALVVDGGGLVGSPIDTGARVLAPTLRARRRAEVRVAILSHPHPDHFLGFAHGLDGVRLGSLWDTGQGEREGVAGAYGALLDRARRAAIPVMRPGDVCGGRDLGGARMEVLAPCPAPAADRGPNDNSLVFRLVFGRRRFLFVGDAEQEEEADLMRLAEGRLAADVLKVGHHGSRTSSGASFLAAVSPRVAVISSGARNRFGHPHGRTLEALAAVGATVLRTDEVGAVTVTTDGSTLEVSAAALR